MISRVCKHCGGLLTLGHIFKTEDGDFICHECANEYYIRCSSCDNYIAISEKRITCLECDSKVYNKVCNAYSTKPIPRFNGRYNKDKGERFYGIELEINNLKPQDAYILFNDLYKEKKIYNKSDGSISGGVEIVTNPFNYSNMIKLLTAMDEGLELIKKEVRDYKANAGIHIHVNRKSLDPLDIIKLSYLFNYRSDSAVCKRLLYYISGRNSNSKNQTDIYSYCRIGTVGSIRKLQIPDERYLAFNIMPENTVEFRLFKTTADINSIIMYIDFVNLAIEYCHLHGLKQINITSFISWIKDKSDNKILLKRIRNFERYNKISFDEEDNIYSIDISILKGIKVNKYMDLLEDLYKCKDVRTMALVINQYKNNNRCSISLTRNEEQARKFKIVRVIENTLRKVLINKIIRKVNEQCA